VSSHVNITFNNRGGRVSLSHGVSNNLTFYKKS